MSILKPSGKRTNHKKGIAAAHLASKRQEAKERQANYDKKTVQEIVSDLNAGNYRAECQRRKLAARLASENAAAAAKKETKGAAKPKRNG